MKNFIIYIIAIFAIFTVSAETKTENYETRSIRAERYFFYKEWSSALAMYQLMIDEQPGEVEPYYKSIVAGVMIGDTITQIDMLERTYMIQAYTPILYVVGAFNGWNEKIGTSYVCEEEANVLTGFVDMTFEGENKF